MEQTNTIVGIQLAANTSNNTPNHNNNNNNNNTSGSNLVNQQSNLNTSGNSNSGSVIVHQGLNQSTGSNQQGNEEIGGNNSETRRLSQGAQSNTTSPGLSPQGKTFGRNFNGTMVVTSTPSNEAELQLYRVLQRASLLAYYDTLLEMGGDDVQQLCDAGEEEFLEIMALVGMASKPLHVRRLQKALHEWVNNPASFQTPLSNTEHKIFPDTPRLMLSPEPVNSTTLAGVASRNLFGSPITSSSTIGSTNVPSFTALQHPIVATNLTSFNQLSSTANPILPTSSSSGSSTISSHHHHQHHHQHQHQQLSGPAMSQLTPTLSDAQISRLVQAAERLSRQLPQIEPKQQNLKKRSSRELEQVMTMSDSDPRRMDEIRKYAAIYGRFDCKRRPEKPLTLHEVCVNEAAAQICKYVPALLTRRHELFPLARQIVRDSGFGHSTGVARFGLTTQNLNRNLVETAGDHHDTTMNSTTGSSGNQMKRTRLSSETSADLVKDLLEESRNNSLLSIYQRIGKTFDLTDSTMRFGYSKSDFDDNDSTFSFGSSNSPIQGSNGIEQHNENSLSILENPVYTRSGNDSNHMDRNQKSPERMDSPVGVQIISSSGGHIIAVANPALALSAALNETFANMKRETVSPDDIR